MKHPLVSVGLAMLLCACSSWKTGEEKKAGPASPAAAPLSEQEVLSRFEQTVPKMKACFEQISPPAGKKYPRTARLTFAYTSNEQGLVKEAKVLKGNFRFKEVAPCLEHQLEGLQLDPVGTEERRISLQVNLRK